MNQQRTRLAYRWQYHLFTGGLGLLSLGLMIVGRRRRPVQPPVAAAVSPWSELAGLVTDDLDRSLRPAWADRLDRERAALRTAVSAYLGIRAYQLAHSREFRNERDGLSSDGRLGR